MTRSFTHCYIDESVHEKCDFFALALVFGNSDLEKHITLEWNRVGFDFTKSELKSSARMDTDPKMRLARDRAREVAVARTKAAIYFGAVNKNRIGHHCLQALQSVLLRNALPGMGLSVYCDRGLFTSVREAERLRKLFRALDQITLHAQADSKKVVGIQIADIMAHTLAQIVKQELGMSQKILDIGGPGSGYRRGTKVSLKWDLLNQIRNALFTRPIEDGSETCPLESDPVVLDPMHDDVATFSQFPSVLGWGVHLAPESSSELRIAVERSLGRIWLGCIH